MTADRSCPGCGQPLAADAPRGLCPLCLLQQGLQGSGIDTGAAPPVFSDLTISLEPASSSVLARIAESIGHLPHVLLRDTETETGPGPIVKPSSPEMPPPGERPEKYQIFGEIARGGMGAILRGRDVDLGRDLAVKVLLDSHKDKPEMVRRFVEEAQVGGQLQHPGVVPVYELGAFADRRPFFTMKLVKGRTLADLLRARSSPSVNLPRFLSIFESIAQTMAYAHVRGVIHRDLKPSNVMVGSFGEVQVMDWGLSKVLPQGGATDDEPVPRPDAEAVSVIRTGRSESEADASQAGSVLGTPGYMAPEQARGEIEAVDERADVFGLGAILCEILTGQPAFVARTPGETMRKAARGELTEPFSRLDTCGADSDLVALAKDCLAAEREDRPRRAGVVAERITAHLTGVQERLRKAELARVTAETRASEERKRRHLTVGLAASILALILLGGGFAVWQSQQRQVQLANVERTLTRIQTLRDQAAADGAGSPRWRETFAAADQALASIGKLVASDPGLRLTALRARIAEELSQAEFDRTLVEELASIRTSVAKVSWELDPAIIDRRFATAFKRHKLDLHTMPTREVVERLSTRPEAFIREVVGSLDHWLVFLHDLVEQRPDKEERSLELQRLLDVLAEVDADPERNRLRAMLNRPDLKPYAEALRAIARGEKVTGYSPSSSLLLSRALQQAQDRESAAMVLRTALVRYPGDAWLNVELASLLSGDEAIRYYTAARALRPEIGWDLAEALQQASRNEEAEAILRELARREPETTRNLVQLSRVLHLRGKLAEEGFVVRRMLAPLQARLKGVTDDAAVYREIALLHLVRLDIPSAIAAYRQAVRTNPDSAVCHRDLAILLRRQGDLKGAIAAYREAIRVVPTDVESHYSLATTLGLSGDASGEIAELRIGIRLQNELRRDDRSIKQISAGETLDDCYLDSFSAGVLAGLDPDDGEVGPIALAGALAESSDFSSAIAVCDDALRGVDPNNQAIVAELSNRSGDIRRLNGDPKGAISLYRTAIHLAPAQMIEARYSLSLSLVESGDLPGGSGALRDAMSHEDQKRIEPYRLLRGILMAQRPDNAVTSLRRVREYARGDPALTDPIDLAIRRYDWLQKNGVPIPRLVRLSSLGSSLPEHYYQRRFYASSAAIWFAGFATDQKQAENMVTQNRYNAACTAALAGAGKGIDRPPLDDGAKARWRKQAIEWLKADLAYWAKQAQSGSTDSKAQVFSTLQHWKSDPDVAGIRDEEPLKTLAEDERRACRALWAEVDRLLRGGNEVIR